MRQRGSRFELLRMRPHDHIGWVFSGSGQFASLATPFLTEGASRGELLMYVSDDPELGDLKRIAGSLAPGALQVTTVADVYGHDGIVDAEAQRAVFAGALETALADGYSGIRVAADNTPLVRDPRRLEAWIRWELVADRFMSENAVTGLCAFDRQRVDVDTLRHLATLHPLASAEEPRPQFLLFSDGDMLCLEGEVDSFAIEQLLLALEQLPPKTGVVADLSETALVTKKVMSALNQLVEARIRVLVRGATERTRMLGRAIGLPRACFLDV